MIDYYIKKSTAYFLPEDKRVQRAHCGGNTGYEGYNVWSTKHITIVAILIQWHLNEVGGVYWNLARGEQPPKYLLVSNIILIFTCE